MVIINGYLYVFGGTTGYLYSTDLHRLDLSTREWTHLKPKNAPLDLPDERSVCLAGLKTKMQFSHWISSDLHDQNVTRDKRSEFSGTDTSWLMMDREYTF